MHAFARAALAGLAALALAAPAAAEAKKSDEELFKLMKIERIGELRLTMKEAEIKQHLPKAPARSAEKLWGADGQYHSKWTYSAQGLALGMVAEKKGGAKSLESIDCSARCTLKTTRGIGIGSTLADVQKAYAAEFNKEDSELPSVFVAGTIYGGLILKFKAGKVSAMFLGAAAE